MIKARSLTRVFQEQSKFLYNQEKPQAWHCRILRASAPAGSGFSIEFPEWHDQAFLIRAKDLGKHRLIRVFHDSLPMFADRVVDYPGQALALLVAPEADQLHKLEQEVHINYTSPSLQEIPSQIAPPESEFFLQRSVQLGDASAVLAQSQTVVKTDLNLDTYHKLHFEPRGAIAEWKSEMLWVQCSTSWPQLVRRLVSESTGLPQKNITVISQPSAWLPDRFLLDSSLLACYAAMAALTCMKQVQLFLSANEDIHYGTRQPSLHSHISTGHAPDGRLLALKAQLTVDLGAWPLGSQESIQFLLAGLCNSYRCPNQDLSVRIKRSAHPPMFLQSAFGLSLAQQAMEQHVSKACVQLDIDELLWRSQNIVSKADAAPFGPMPDHTAAAHQVLQHAIRESDFRRKHAGNELLRKLRPGREKSGTPLHLERRLAGVGMALGYQSHGLLVSTELSSRPRIRLRLNQDGHLEVGCPIHATNTTLKDSWSAALEEFTGIDARNISFARFSTDQLDDSGPARHSRIISLYSPLIAAAGKALRQKISKHQSGTIEIKLSMPNLRRLEWNEETFSGTPFLGRSWAAAVVELMIDPVSLCPIVREVWISINAGAILHPDRASSLINQSVLDSLAWLADPGAIDRPNSPIVHVDFLNQERFVGHEQQLGHAGGIGELTQTVIPAAFANALSQALGQSPQLFPCNSQMICQLLSESRKASHQENSGLPVENLANQDSP